MNSGRTHNFEESIKRSIQALCRKTCIKNIQNKKIINICQNKKTIYISICVKKQINKTIKKTQNV